MLDDIDKGDALVDTGKDDNLRILWVTVTWSIIDTIKWNHFIRLSEEAV